MRNAIPQQKQVKASIIDLDQQFAQHIASYTGYKERSSSRQILVTQYPIVQNTHGSSSNLLTLGIFIDKHERLNINCMIDRQVEVTYCPQDILDTLLCQQSSLVQKYFEANETISALDSIGRDTNQQTGINIIDFKPLWAIRKSLKQ